jgi:hypothetical protein
MLHGATFLFLGAFVASSAGEVLFNRDEADILLHRPLTPQSLLRAKIGVLVRISLWLAVAFNLVGFFVGVSIAERGWLFLPVHAISTALQALFCTAFVVVTYQLCLRFFGRERLEGMMTTVQVAVAIVLVTGGQIVPRVMARSADGISFRTSHWWANLLPPAWFAGFDEALAGSGSTHAWTLAVFGLAATSVLLSLSLGVLARDYQLGLQTLSEVGGSGKAGRSRGRRVLDAVVHVPPLRWWLRDRVVRSSFLLIAAYLGRNRDVKLRFYPVLAQMMILPLFLLLPSTRRGGHLPDALAAGSVAFAAAFVGIVPTIAIEVLQYSQDWQASDLFRVAPLAGPAPLIRGALHAVSLFVTLPVALLTIAFAWFMRRDGSFLPLVLPGLIALPIWTLLAAVIGGSVPLASPVQTERHAGRGLKALGIMLACGLLAVIAVGAWEGGWFYWFLCAEVAFALALYAVLKSSLTNVQWDPID